MEMLLSVIIVNYRTPGMVVDCLQTLLPELSGLNAKIVIVDNCSGDQSAGIIQEWLEHNDRDQQALLVQSPTNTGFAGGNNTGIRALRARFYLLLNSDTLVIPGAITRLLDTANRHPDAGLISPRLEWPDGNGQESCFRYHTPVSELMAAAQTGPIDRWLAKYVVALPVQPTFATPEWTSFACVLIRNSVFNQIGLLDDGYFMYYEDVEFCHRARRAGWQILHDPVARIVHLRGGSSPVKENTRRRKRLPRYYYESRSRYFCQVYGWPGLIEANLAWWLGRCVSKLRQLLGADRVAIEKQWLDIWINCSNPLGPYTPPQ